MPKYLIDPAARTVFTITSEALNARGLAKLFELIKKDPRFRPQYDHLIDFRATQELSITFTAAMRVGELSPFWPQSRWAWVAATDLQRSLSSMLMAMTALEHETEHFSDIQQAQRWLLGPTLSSISSYDLTVQSHSPSMA